MIDEKISNIKKLKITCKNCKTEIITDIGKDIANCPCCYAKFIQSIDDNPYQSLSQTFATLKQSVTADFSLVFDEAIARLKS